MQHIDQITARTQLLASLFENGTITPAQLREYARLTVRPVARLRDQLAHRAADRVATPPPVQTESAMKTVPFVIVDSSGSVRGTVQLTESEARVVDATLSDIVHDMGFRVVSPEFAPPEPADRRPSASIAATGVAEANVAALQSHRDLYPAQYAHELCGRTVNVDDNGGERIARGEVLRVQPIGTRHYVYLVNDPANSYPIDSVHVA